MRIRKDKKPMLKKLSPAMERLVGSLSNQGIWGVRREEVIKQLQDLEGRRAETESHLNRLQGEINATINGIIDNDSKLKAEDILEEAQNIVRVNAEQQQNKFPLKSKK